jgi:Fe2+ or Zn2+ uptake regulation protein
MTPAQVYRRAHEVMPGITEATVYRTLSFLAAQGLVQPAYIGSGQFVYEYGGQDHHHLICRRCGGMHAIDHETLIPLYRQVQESTGFQIDSVHLTFFGLCPECARN